MLIDGVARNACTTRLVDVRDGAVIEAYEDVSSEDAAVRAVSSFTDERPTRCSLCLPCVGVTAVALARSGKAGEGAAVDAALADAACMCTGRGSMRRALTLPPRKE